MSSRIHHNASLHPVSNFPYVGAKNFFSSYLAIFLSLCFLITPRYNDTIKALSTNKGRVAPNSVLFFTLSTLQSLQ